MGDQVVQLPDWQLYIFRLAREILQEQSPSKLLQARDMMYELLSNCIPGDVIINTLTDELMKVFDCAVFATQLLAYIIKIMIIIWCVGAGRHTEARACALGGVLRAPHGQGLEGDLPPGGLRRQVHGHLQKVAHLVLWLNFC